jgi:hypothetical protein
MKGVEGEGGGRVKDSERRKTRKRGERGSVGRVRKRSSEL